MTNVTLSCRGHRHWLGVAAGLLVAGASACGSGDDERAAPAPAPSPSVPSLLTPAPAGEAGSAAPGEAAPAPASGAAAAGASEGAPPIEGLDDGEAPDDGASPASEPPEPPAAEPPPAPEPADPRPFFSFFAASQAGMYGLSAGEFAPAPDPVNGFGGNFGGLAGADEICTRLARAASPGDTKVWRAFLSTSGFAGGERVDAIDRVGEGPWYDYNGLPLAENVEELLPQNGRPSGADPQLAAMFTDENGAPIRPNNQIDNHDTLTGSGTDGRLYDDGEGGRIATCEDWTSSTVRGQEGNFAGMGGQVPVGHSWPRSNNNGRNWIQDHTINGCEPGADIDGGAGAPPGDFRVGAGGGFGGIYCFALGAVAPE